MKKHLIPGLVMVAASLGLAGCDISPVPGPAYHFTADELAWQGYQQGQQLRFGRAGSSRVRTYLISELNDRMEQQYQSFWIAPVQGQPPTFQHITVKGYRTDSVIYKVGSIANPRDSTRVIDTFLDLYKYLPSVSPSDIELRATVGWDHWFNSYPPLQEISRNQPLLPGGNATLLPTVTLGGIAYGPTLLINRGYAVSPAPRQRVISRIWYARGKGVVGYEEVGTGFWYRLP